jgi:hypothetical protein
MKRKTRIYNCTYLGKQILISAKGRFPEVNNYFILRNNLEMK